MTTIVAGYYFKKNRGKTIEVKLTYEGSSMFELSNGVVKVLVAQDLGFTYITEIDFEYFDRSCDDIDDIDDGYLGDSYDGYDGDL